MPLQGPTVREIKEEYGREQAAILTQTFDTHAKAVDATPEVKLPSGVGLKESNAVRQAAINETAAGIRDELRNAFIDKDLELVAAVKEREARIEEYLAPRSQSSEALAQFMAMSEAQLITAADVAAMADMEDTLRLLLSVSRARDLDMATNHIAALGEEDGWEDLLAELYEAEQVKDLSEADDRFEQLAQSGQSQQRILGAEQPDINVSAQMR